MTPAGKPHSEPTGYLQSGVDTFKEESALSGLLKWINKTFELRPGPGRVALPIGYFANVLDLGNNLGLAISTDGVGTKLLVAQMMDKYDTIGIDCIAMNVNDVLCVGAEPISMVDYIAVQEINPAMVEDIGKGLYKGCEMAGINISGGEMAQVREMIKGRRRGKGFDIAGTCVGLVPMDRIIIGADVKENEVVVGFKSSGIHSNGMTMARRVLFQDAGFRPGKYFEELGRTLGEELLEPTRIYVKEVVEMLRSGIRIKAMAHITSDGLLNLTRTKAAVGYRIHTLPDPPPIFGLIQKSGKVSDEEMYRVFNMGAGFCVVVPHEDADRAIKIAARHGTTAFEIGHTFPDEDRRVFLEPRHLVGKDNRFSRSA
ncbi:MAG: phosphoribosylformylglycinamidine cyclo-ligase [Chloroflexi bacterium]|nr:phosphoribosylformylglycinamidine cyclo-ligase [Chloroflexota bacterium]